MSEHPLITLPTGPRGNSVIGGLSTVEVRWILPGQLDAAIAGWFRRFPAETETREDAYLIHPDLRGVSVKIRAGRALEVKLCHGCPGILDEAGRARGRLESCRKWSFPFGPPGPYGAGPSAWTVVHKRRRISRYQLASGRIMASVAGAGRRSQDQNRSGRKDTTRGFRQASRHTGSTPGFSMGSGELARSPMMGDVGDAKCCEPGQWLRR